MTQPEMGRRSLWVGVEELGLAATCVHSGELPGLIVRVINAGTGAVTAAVGWQLVGGVPDEDGPSTAQHPATIVVGGQESPEVRLRDLELHYAVTQVLL